MRYWDTGDEATNANLEYLENLGRLWEPMDVEQFMGKLRGVIQVRKMLPAAVACYFDFPFLFIGSDAYRWKPDRLREEAVRLCDAINQGLQKAQTDPLLKRGSGADLSDRPRSAGERILEALAAFEEHRGSAELSKLCQSIFGTNLAGKMDQLEKTLQRKRPMGSLSPEELVLRAIGDIEWHASRYYHQAAGGS